MQFSIRADLFSNSVRILPQLVLGQSETCDSGFIASMHTFGFHLKDWPDFVTRCAAVDADPVETSPQAIVCLDAFASGSRLLPHFHPKEDQAATLKQLCSYSAAIQKTYNGWKKFLAGETDDVANSVEAYAEWFEAFVSLPRDPLLRRVGSEDVCTSATAQSEWPLETFRFKLLGLQTHGDLLESATTKLLANLKMAPAIASTILDHKEYVSAQLRELAAAARGW